MNGRQIVSAALSGKSTSQVGCGPLAVHFCARQAGRSIRDYTTDATALSDSVLFYCEKYRPDVVWISADTWVSAEAMGATVDFPGDEQPMCGVGEPVIQTPADIDRIPPADPQSQGRQPLMLEALERVAQQIGDEVFVVACFDQSPFSLACAMAGINEVMIKLIDDMVMVEALLGRCVEYATAYGLAMADRGAHMLSTGDSPAGMIGPQLYHDVVQPAEQQVFQSIKRHTEAFVSLHICGDTTPLLPAMATSGADVLELDHQVDLAEACRTVGSDVAVWGNLDPVSVLARGDAQTVRDKTNQTIDAVSQAGHKRFILSSGCTLTPDTPEDNLRALFETARQRSL